MPQRPTIVVAATDTAILPAVAGIGWKIFRPVLPRLTGWLKGSLTGLEEQLASHESRIRARRTGTAKQAVMIRPMKKSNQAIFFTEDCSC